MQVSIILLAAGKGLRFKNSIPDQSNCTHIKQLALLQGEPLILRCLTKLHAVAVRNSKIISSIFVTLGANYQAIRELMPVYTSLIQSPNYSLGLGHSLADTINVVAAQSSHVFIALADQPLINEAHYHALLAASSQQPNKIITSQCNGRLMAPAIFPQRFFSLLKQLQGDQGAGKLLKRFPEDIVAISCSNAMVDIDTVQDLINIEEQLTNQAEQKNNLEPV